MGKSDYGILQYSSVILKRKKGLFKAIENVQNNEITKNQIKIQIRYCQISVKDIHSWLTEVGNTQKSSKTRGLGWSNLAWDILILGETFWIVQITKGK